MAYSFGHANTSVADGERLVGLVGNDVDAKVLARVELAGILKGGIADLVKSVRAVGDKLSQEDLLVAVDGVDDQAQELADLSLDKKVSHSALRVR